MNKTKLSKIEQGAYILEKFQGKYLQRLKHTFLKYLGVLSVQ